jgi:hypothetical protein
MIRRSRKFAGSGLLGALALALTSAASDATDATADVEFMVTSFDRIVFHAEFGQTIEPRISKWVDPIAVYLDIRAGDPTLYRRLVDAHIQDIRDLTGLTIDIVSSADASNFHVVFERNDALIGAASVYLPTLSRHSAEIAGTLCFGIYSVNGSNEIKRAIIGIPTDRAASSGKLPACIIEEMTQVLGLPNDSDDVQPSIFNDHSVDDALTTVDRMLIRLLYDRALYPGMARDEALAKVRSLADNPLIAEEPLLPNIGRSTASASRADPDGNSSADAIGGGGIQSAGDKPGAVNSGFSDGEARGDGT